MLSRKLGLQGSNGGTAKSVHQTLPCRGAVACITPGTAPSASLHHAAAGTPGCGRQAQPRGLQGGPTLLLRQQQVAQHLLVLLLEGCRVVRKAGQVCGADAAEESSPLQALHECKVASLAMKNAAIVAGCCCSIMLLWDAAARSCPRHSCG